MPTATFSNLPQEKKERLLAAACREFARVPYSEASINQIIQDVGISRGSFYTYFADKADLIFCILEDFFDKLMPEIIQVLQQTRGDIFAAFLQLYDFVAEYSSQNNTARMFHNLIISLNADEHANLQKLSRVRQDLVDSAVDLIDFSKLRLNGHKNREDLEDLMILLVSVTKISCLETLVLNDDLSRNRLRFIKRLDLLRYGIEQH